MPFFAERWRFFLFFCDFQIPKSISHSLVGSFRGRKLAWADIFFWKTDGFFLKKSRGCRFPFDFIIGKKASFFGSRSHAHAGESFLTWLGKILIDSSSRAM